MSIHSGKDSLLISIDDAIACLKKRRAIARHPEIGAVREAEPSSMVLGRIDLDRDGMAKVLSQQTTLALRERGWDTFLIEIRNPHNLTRPLITNRDRGFYEVATSWTSAQRPANYDRLTYGPLFEDMWLLASILGPPLLSGEPIEYRMIDLYAQLPGKRSAYLAFKAPQDGDDRYFGGRQGLQIDANCAPAQDVEVHVVNQRSEPVTAYFEIKDSLGRLYPPKRMRLAPDMSFQEGIYRSFGEVLRLPLGRYTVEVRRGPESLTNILEVPVTADNEQSLETTVDLWVETQQHGLYSADMHLHAAGCSHYDIPAQGVAPQTMIRLVRGEGLDVGGVLAWGPCFYHQKGYFQADSFSPPAELELPELQRAQGNHWTEHVPPRDVESWLLYGLEVSHFPSSHAGHLLLWGLDSLDYPGTRLIEDWPSWNLPIARWARSQGAYVAYGHVGLGMEVDVESIPNAAVPEFKGIGLNEGLVDIAFGVVDFLDGATEAPASELNAWYHILNCGFHIPMMGGTDFPCVYHERTGVSRTYVRLDSAPSGPSAGKKWLDGLKMEPGYFGDGRSHFLTLRVGGIENPPPGRFLKVEEGKSLRIRAMVTAALPQLESPTEERIRMAAPFTQPTWSLTRSRIPGTNRVPVELVANGRVAATRTTVADGQPHPVDFEVTLEESSWIALRILPSSHTQPIWVEVGETGFRPVRGSALWCARSVEALWKEKGRFIRESERPKAEEAYRWAAREYARRAERPPLPLPGR